MAASPAGDSRLPSRVSIFLTPVCLLLAIAFVGAYYWATIPSASLREQPSMLPISLLAVISLGIPVAGFWKNRQLFARARSKELGIAASLLVAEASALLFTLLVFANMATGGEDETRLKARANALTIEAAEVRKLIEQRVMAAGRLSGAGEGLKIESVAHRGETFVGTDGTVLLYDLELRALVALLPTYRERVLDWRLVGLPARAFPLHWRSLPQSSFTREAQGAAIEHSQALLKIAGELQQGISSQAKQLGSLAAVTDARALPASGLLDFGYVDADGRFALYSDRHGVFLVYEPTMRGDGRVDWRCRSYPSEAAVPGCASAFN